MNDILATIFVALGTGFAGAFSGWFFTRKRQNLENIDIALDTWQKVIDSLERRVSVQLDKIDKFAQENDDLRTETLTLKREICRLKKENDKLIKLEAKIKYYEKILADNGITY